MKPHGKSWLLFAVILLGCAVAVGIHFMPRKTSRQQAQVGPVLVPALEPLRVEQSAPDKRASLRPAVRRLLDPATHNRTRIDLALTCDRDLNNDEITALLAEVSTPAVPGVDPGWHSQYLHEICRQLHHHSSIRNRFARVLVGVSADTERPHVEREYAVQHLREVWQRAADDTTLRQALVGHFKALVRDSRELAGPALLSLHFLGNDPGREWNGSGAIIANNELEPLVSRLLDQSRDKVVTGGVMAALRVAGDRALPGAMPSIKQVAADSSVTAIVRMAAVSIIAKSSPDPAFFLQSITPGEPLVDQAIRLSLKKSL
jgi:hypothetical protein